jgi:hypothetical protein
MGVSMRRNKTHQRGRVRLLPKFRVRLVQVLVVCGVGYLIVGSYTVALRSADLSAAETVALRFPENLDNAPAAPRVLVAAIATAHAAGNAQAALLSPEPMMPQANTPHSSASTLAQNRSASASTGEVQVASADITALQASSEIAAPVQASPLPAPTRVAAVPVKEIKVVAPAARRVINRPGYMLNDAQIASIKARLHLTPDQERMWPTVEVALRNMTYTHAPEAHGRSSATNESASVDPDSVQGLKSAAVPLILSFNTEQKDEVRNIVHVMGLDQLASQF